MTEINGRCVFWKLYYGSNGENKPTEWVILKEENRRKLLLSKYIIDAVDYHEAGKAGSWKECSLRTWLNTEFLYQVFSREESSCLVESERTETTNSFYKTKDSNGYKDKVFLLSAEEFKKDLETGYAKGPVKLRMR